MYGFRFGFPVRNQPSLALTHGLNFFWGKRKIPAHLLAKISKLHKLGVDGDKNAVQEAFSLLNKVQQFFPNNAMVKAYYGSVLALMGRDALDPMERLEKVRQGLKYMDDAVQQEPDLLEIRILRGYVCYRLPEIFFHKTATGIEDFSYIRERYKKDSSVFSADFYRQILHDLITAHQTLGRDRDAQLIREELENLY